MILLALQLYESPGGAIIADFSDATSCKVDNGPHGYRSLTCFVPMSLELVFFYAQRGLGGWLSLNYGAGVVWEGRVEDIGSVIAEDGTGLGITAFGAWRAMMDVPYTALWSASGTAKWQILTADDYTFINNDRFEIDNNNRLYIAPKKNAGMATTIQGGIAFKIDDASAKNILGIDFDYQVAAPSGTWTVAATGWDATFATNTSIWSSTFSGSGRGAIHAVLGTSRPIVTFRLWNTATTTYSGESGAVFVKITNIRLVTTTTNRVNTTTSTTITAGSRTVTPSSMTGIYVGQRLVIDSGEATSESVVVTAVTSTTFTATFVNAYSGTTTIQAHVVYSDEIISDLVSHVATVNPDALSDSTALIESPGLDLLDESYEDAWPGDIATKLAGLGDNQDPPRQWEVGVWDNQLLHFRPKGSGGQAWVIDADEMQINSTLDLLRNSAYATYQDENGRTLRTAVSDDDASQLRYGIVRRKALSVRTTSATQAGVHRDALLADGKTVRPRSSVTPDYLMSPAGAIVPKWMARAGDTLTIRNLPPTLGEEVDRVRTFTLGEASYDVMADALTPVPEEPLASLDYLIARQAESFDQ